MKRTFIARVLPGASGLRPAISVFLLALLFPAGGTRAAAEAPSRPLTVVIGGFDPARPADVPGLVRQLETALPAMKSVGATSHEGYVRWNLIEPRHGRFDFSVYDAFVNLYKKYGMKWMPFLIIGSPYSIPDWNYKTKDAQGYVCLEHGLESDVQSLWNPAMRLHVDRVVREFARHYRDSGVVESVLIGVTGNYGEAIYPASGNDWTSDIHGQYHTHAGYWAGDKFAKESFRKWLRTKYKTVEALNGAWGAGFAGFEAVEPRLRKDTPSDRAWYDFITWYRESMNDHTDFWVGAVRKYFPSTDIYICTGGDANPQHGSDFAAQARIAAKYRAGVRITNEASDYALNFSVTRWVASAAKQYGAYFAFEPAGYVDASGVTARVYNVLASGAAQLHSYWGNIFDTPDRTAAFERDLPKFRPTSPLVDIALYYSKPSVAFDTDFYSTARELRDYFDYDIVDDSMIRDGGLDNHHILFWMSGNRIEPDAVAPLLKWISGGGLLVYNAASGAVRNDDGSAPAGWPEALAVMADADAIKSIASMKTSLTAERIIKKNLLQFGGGKTLLVPRSDADAYLKVSLSAKVIRLLFEGKLGFAPRTAEAVDLERDAIYSSLIDNGETLAVLSQNKSETSKTFVVGGKTATVETKPNEIIEVKLK